MEPQVIHTLKSGLPLQPVTSTQIPSIHELIPKLVVAELLLLHSLIDYSQLVL